MSSNFAEITAIAGITEQGSAPSTRNRWRGEPVFPGPYPGRYGCCTHVVGHSTTTSSTLCISHISRRPPDYSSNLCPPKTFAIWLFGGCFGHPSCCFSCIKGPKHPLKKSYSKSFRRTQIIWAIWRSSNFYLFIFQFLSGTHENMGLWGKRTRKFTRTSPRTLPWNFIAILSAPLILTGL